MYASALSIRFGLFTLDLKTGELKKDGASVKLAPQPSKLLLFLVHRAGQIVTREELQQCIWSNETFVDFDKGLNFCIKQIRAALGDDAEQPIYIETLPRRGYRFIAPLADISTPSIFPSTREPTLSHAHEITSPGVSDCSVLAPESGFASKRLRVLLGTVALLTLFGLGLVRYLGSPKKLTEPAIKSLAVLPFNNLSGDSSQEYLADGITDAIIGRLSNIHDLRVISRTSVMRFKDTRLSAPEVARTLGVDVIVEGSVIREGNRIRVQAQLIRASKEEHFWSEAYDREMSDVLSLESDVAQAIAGKVEVTVTGQEHTRLADSRYVAPEVYESYLKGQNSKGNTRADLEQSIGYFEEAIRRDPTFAPAYVGLAEVYDDLDNIFVGGAPGEVRPKVVATARKALELDPTLAEPHALIAGVYQTHWQWREAEEEYKRALALNPNDVGTHLGFASWLLAQGRIEEALAWSRRARALDPLGVTGVSTGWILFHARRYDEAIRELRSVVEVHPDYASAHYFLGFALIGKGQVEEAILVLQKTVSMMHRSPGSIELLATAYARAGHRSSALRLIDELKRRRQTTYIPAGAFINPHLALGDYDEAFVWFERAYQEHSNILQFLKVHPFFDPVRKDPRFADLLRRVGLN